MAQARAGLVFPEPDLMQTASLFDPLDAPFGVAGKGGIFLYSNPALEALLRDCGWTEPPVRLCDWLDTNGIAAPFLPSGEVDARALPFLGKVRLKVHLPQAETREALVRLEIPQAANSPAPVVFCTILPYAPAASPASALEGPQWLPRIEEIGDSFDIARISTKTCKIIEDLLEARAVAFYWMHAARLPAGGGGLLRAEQMGQVRFLADAPEHLEVREGWIQRAAREGILEFARINRESDAPAQTPATWRPGGDGFVLACKARGDLLGIALVWTDPARIRPKETRDLLDQISFQAAQAVDHARWFLFTRQSETRSAQTIENANAMMFGTDLQGRITLWNRKASEVLGYDAPEILGKPVFALFSADPAQAAHAERRLRDALASGKALTDFEAVMTNKEGAERHVIWNTNVLTGPEGAVLGLCAVGQDVTRRKELERRLAASEKRYRNLIETTHDLYWVLLFESPEKIAQGEVAFLNRPFAGRGQDAVAGKGIQPLKETFYPGSWEIFEKACRQVLKTERPVHRVETEHMEPGENRPSVFLMHDLFPCYEEDALVGVQGLSIDITRHKEIEAQMLQAQKLESVGTLARGVAHDFNNILNGINGFAFMLLRHADEPEEILQAARAVQDLVQRATGLTRQLQTYARQGRPEKRPLDLNEILRQTVKILEAGVARHVTIQTDLDENLEWIEADRSQMEQVVMNLCINAVEAMPDGGVLSLQTRAVALEPSDPLLTDNAQAGHYALLQVRDTGVGMDPQVKARIFDPFYTTKKTGNGLGLSAVYGILQAHQALARVDSEIGVGSCFSLYFPAGDARRASLGETGSAAVRGGNETILVVDDENAVRVVCRDILSTLGYRVILAPDGETAVRVFQERPHAIDLILMDIAMPNLNGCAAAKAMRLFCPGVKILFTSGYTDKAQVETLQQDGFPYFLGKPYSMLDLQKIVRNILDAKPDAPPQRPRQTVNGAAVNREKTTRRS